MKLFIGRNSQAISFIEPFLIADDDYEQGAYVELLKHMIIERPENIYLPIAVEGDKPVAFLIAIAPDDQKHVWIMQAWASKDLTKERMKDTLFLELIMWTLGLGRRSIRAETKRNTGPFLRRWGFSTFSEILDYGIKDDFEASLLNQVKQNIKDNRLEVTGESNKQTGHENDIDPKPRSKSRVFSHEERAAQRVGKGSVSRKASSSARSGDGESTSKLDEPSTRARSGIESAND